MAEGGWSATSPGVPVAIKSPAFMSMISESSEIVAAVCLLGLSLPEGRRDPAMPCNIAINFNVVRVQLLYLPDNHSDAVLLGRGLSRQHIRCWQVQKGYGEPPFFTTRGTLSL
jgi:hypothetical protein